MANVYIETPIGTDIEVTNEITKQVEAIIDSTVYKNYEDCIYLTEEDSAGVSIEVRKPFISSILAQVGEGTSDPASGQMGGGSTPHKARVAVQFADFEHRFHPKTGNLLSSQKVLDELRAALKRKFTADVSIVITKNQNGPPQDPPINIEVWGPGEYDQTIAKAQKILGKLSKGNVRGIEKLRLDVETGKPELLLEVDRNKAIRFGLSTQQIGSSIRTAIF